MPNYYRTKILTSIKSLEEISLVLNKGVDIIDFKDPSHGALGEIPANKISFFLKSIPSNHGYSFLSTMNRSSLYNGL